MKEYKRMQESPPPYIKARRNEKYIDNGDQKFDSAPNTNKFSQVEVNEKNILEWYFLMCAWFSPMIWRL